MIRAPFRLSWIDEPRYGRFFFLEAFGIVRTLYFDDKPVVSVDPPVAAVTRKTFRWDYRTIANLKLATERLRIDPDSGLPIGSIVRNYKGEYGVIDYKAVIRISKGQRDELLRRFGETPPKDLN